MIRWIAATVATILVVLAVFVAGVVVGGHAQDTGLTRLSDPVRGWLLGDSGQDLTAQVLRVLQEQYYVPVDRERLDRTSAQAIVDSLDDPYTDYLDPDELRALRAHNDGRYVGIGVQLTVRGERDLTITHVYDDGPAADAGVRVGDRITAVDGQPVGDAPIDTARLAEIIAAIQGPEGTRVRITFVTGSAAPRELEMTRESIRVPPVETRIIARDGARVGYLDLAKFTRGAADDVRAALGDLRAKGATSIVFDLREDPGGLVAEAVGVAGAFLPDGSPVVTTKGLNSAERTYRTSGAPSAGEIPLVVLVDRNSASASEIVAGALRDAKRARLVGERTFGKALVQSTVALRDGGALKLTTARYLTPSGYDLAKRGLRPSVKAVDDPATPVDEALRRAVGLAAQAG